MDISSFLHRNRSSLRIGLKLLAAIIGIEFLIMTVIEISGLDHASLWTGVLDALVLGLLSSLLIYSWVVRPLKHTRDQNSMFSTVVNNLSVGVVVTAPQDGEQRITAVNPAFLTITGYASEEVIGSHPRFLQGEESDRRTVRRARQAISKGRPIQTLIKNHRKDGSEFWNNLHLSPVRDNKGDVVSWIGLIEDVTEQEDLRTRADLLQRAVDQGDEAICIFGADGVIEAVNPAYYQTAGMQQDDDLVGNQVWSCWDDTDASTAEAKAAVSKGEAWHGRHRRRRVDESSYEALSSISPVTDEHGVLRFSSVHRDISEQRQMENQLMQSQKMEAVGTLAGGIAHDFNNILAGMLGNLYMIQRDLQGNPKALDRLKRVEKQGYFAADLIRQLLTFARSEVMDKKDFDLAPFFKEMVKFARPGVPENIELVYDLEDVGMMVNGDPGRMQQALLNLINNARHAIEQKEEEGTVFDGRITLRSGIRVDRPNCRGGCYESGRVDQLPENCVFVEVEDNGIGMDEATRSKIFDPYFTTKESDRGTGLGLPMVLGCMELHGGCIEVESMPGEGTLFRCWLPLLADSKKQGMEDDELGALELMQGNGELILVADDNTDAREALCEILAGNGFEVVSAADGEEAQQKFFTHQKQLHAAFLDVVMPRCSGTVVAKYIIEVCPDMPVVMMTGYDLKNTLASEEFVVQGNIEVLSKPWNIPQLNDALLRVRSHYAKVANGKS